jgi:hypothetical protein
MAVSATAYLGSSSAECSSKRWHARIGPHWLCKPVAARWPYALPLALQLANTPCPLLALLRAFPTKSNIDILPILAQ